MMITINCLATIFILLPINVIVSITMLDVIVVPSNPLCSRSGQTSRHETRQKTARKLEFFAKAMGMFGISDIETYPNMSTTVGWYRKNIWVPISANILLKGKYRAGNVSWYVRSFHVSERSAWPNVRPMPNLNAYLACRGPSSFFQMTSVTLQKTGSLNLIWRESLRYPNTSHVKMCEVLTYRIYIYMIRYDMMWYDMIWYDVMWCDMIWYEMIYNDMMY